MLSTVKQLARTIFGKGRTATHLNGDKMPTRADVIPTMLRASGVLFWAKVTQSSTNAPATASNPKITDPRFTYTWARSNAGIYTLTIAKAQNVPSYDVVFDVDKVFVEIDSKINDSKLSWNGNATITNGALVITFTQTLYSDATTKADVVNAYIKITHL